jgi:hypothetical protein
MFLEKFSTWPTPKRKKQILISSIILLIVIYPIMSYLFMISYPVTFFESQLSFSGSYLKDLHSTISSAKLNLYTIANILDYVFMVSYGGILASLALIFGRKFEITSGWRKSSYYAVIISIIAPICDAIENLFILLMLSDPLGFPDIWAIIHSWFALIKYALMFLGFGWLFTILIKLIINKISSNNI